MKKYKGFCKNISTKINHYFTFFRTVRLFSSIFHANIRFFMWFSNRIRISEHLLLFLVRHSVYPPKMHISHTGPTTLPGMFQFPAITISSFSRPIFVHIFSYFQKQLFYFSVCQKNKKDTLYPPLLSEYSRQKEAHTGCIIILFRLRQVLREHCPAVIP